MVFVRNEAAQVTSCHVTASSPLIGQPSHRSSRQHGAYPGGACCGRRWRIFKESSSAGEIFAVTGLLNTYCDAVSRR